jgi:hypothetical protein
MRSIVMNCLIMKLHIGGHKSPIYIYSVISKQLHGVTNHNMDLRFSTEVP